MPWIDSVWVEPYSPKEKKPMSKEKKPVTVIKYHELTWTYDVSLDAMKELIAKDLGVPVSEVSVEYVIGDIGPGDPMDRYPAPRGVTGVKVHHTHNGG